jgi:DNA-binding NarL/FixJ family response regulator
MSAPIARCLVADDHPALVSAVADFLADQGFEIIGPAADGAQALAAAESARPELALVDYRMPRSGGGGRELIRRLKEISPATQVAVYTAEANEQVVADVLAAGADAIVLKEAPLLDLVRALRSILDGHPYVDPALAGAALGVGRGPRLTAREADVLRLLAEGLTHEEIGGRLDIASETVRTHARKAADRLGAKTRTQAVATAIRLELI